MENKFNAMYGKKRLKFGPGSMLAVSILPIDACLMG